MIRTLWLLLGIDDTEIILQIRHTVIQQDNARNVSLHCSPVQYNNNCVAHVLLPDQKCNMAEIEPVFLNEYFEIEGSSFLLISRAVTSGMKSRMIEQFVMVCIFR